MAVNAMGVRAGDVFHCLRVQPVEEIYAWKTVAESVTSSTTNQLDDELALPVEPFSSYHVPGVLRGDRSDWR